MGYRTLPVTAFEQNCSIVWCGKTRKAVIVDPGGDEQQIMTAVAGEGVEPVMVALTHGHLDHVGGTAVIARHYGVPVIGPHIADRFWIDALQQQVQMFGFPPVEDFVPDRWLQAGDRLDFGEQQLQVRLCPGHTPGHVVFYHAGEKVAFVGDVIFRGSIGRTDFPQGNHQQLLDSIRQQIFTLDDDVTLVPGHGPNSRVGIEKATNPFVR
ncbi:MAG: MBL fold metallo-hydrolase [Gammaproteobacteria bacterium]|jgi:hydroxyacylglutathione hydrolase